jgi:hypothetical protein
MQVSVFSPQDVDAWQVPPSPVTAPGTLTPLQATRLAGGELRRLLAAQLANEAMRAPVLDPAGDRRLDGAGSGG